MNHISSFIFVSLLLFSCQQDLFLNSSKEGQIPINVKAVTSAQTKTTLSGLSLSWTSGDCIGVFVDGKQENRRFTNISTDNFSGSFLAGKSASSSANYYAYYPYLSSISSSNISAELKSEQKAPFDASMDYMVSDIVTGTYDEENLPDINFSFSNHLFSILKITFTNTDNSYKNEKVSKVVISSKQSDLVGLFSFDASLGENAEPIFNVTGKEVILTFSSKPILSTNVDHSVYAIIKEGTIPDLSLKIYTDNTYGKATANISFATQRGTITSLPKIDFSKMIFSVGASIGDLGDTKYDQDDFWIL